MASIVLDLSGTLPEAFTDGNWPPSTFNSGVWRFTWTPENASTDAPWAGAGTTYWAIFASDDDGGLWTTWEGGTNNIAMFNAVGGANIFDQAVTWADAAEIVITIDHPAEEVTISGCLTGNGTFSFTTANAFTDGNTLRAGRLGAGSTYDLPDSALSDVDDAVDGATGIASITLGAATAVAVGDADLEGITSVTLGAMTAAAVGDADLEGITAVTLGALTADATGTAGSDITGITDVTLGALTAAGVADADLDGATAVTLGALTAAGVADADLDGSTAVTLGALTADATGTVAGDVDGIAAITLGAATAAAVGDADLDGSAAVTLGALTVDAYDSLALALGDYGAERIIFGTGVTEVNLTLNTKVAGSTFIVCTGGRLTDLSTAPTDNKGNTFVALGAAVAYTDWPDYGMRMWRAIDADGGATHIFTQTTTIFD